MRKDIKRQILMEKESSGQYRDQILSAADLPFARFRELFHKYMCAKLLLEAEEIRTDNFYEICALSAGKAANKMARGELDAAEAASKCGGATTAMNKKVLFIMAVRREFSVAITPQESAAIDTFSQLCQCVYEAKGFSSGQEEMTGYKDRNSTKRGGYDSDDAGA